MKEKQLDFCLLIPCYNNYPGLIASLKSVVYDASRFCVLIVDDGSTVPVTYDMIAPEVDAGYAVTVLRNEENTGITDALNTGLKWIEQHLSLRYIARLDCGDICESHRFYREVGYMMQHPDVGLLGSWCLFKDKRSSVSYAYKTPTEHEQIKRAMHFRNLFIHPTVIFKSHLAKEVGYYPSEFVHAEDYAFFWKLIKITRSHILDEFLVTSEINNYGISLTHRQQQLLARARVISVHSTNPFYKIGGILRSKGLAFIPKRLVLLLKQVMTGYDSKRSNVF